jgi:hypothetical protein
MEQGSSDNRRGLASEARQRTQETAARDQSSTAEIGQLLNTLLMARGRSEYKLVLENGILVKIEAATGDGVIREAAGDDYLTMSEASALLHHGRYWLSRTKLGKPMWVHLGLNPRRSGRRILFRRDEIRNHLEGHAVRRPGRPPKVSTCG